MYNKVEKFIKFRTPPNEINIVNTTYYEYAIENFKKICKLQNFPNLNSKDIYKEIIPKWQRSMPRAQICEFKLYETSKSTLHVSPL